MQPQQEEQQKKPEDKPVAVAVITPSGVFPNDDDYRRAFESTLVNEILHAAAVTLQLTNTSDWVAFIDNKEIDPGQTFKHQGLHGIVEIEWHKREGGGGARIVL